MIFDTTVNGIPCQCEVDHYAPGEPMHIHGPGFADADPPEPEEFEYQLLDRRGRRAPWLDQYINSRVEDRLLDEYIKSAAAYHFQEPEDVPF